MIRPKMRLTIIVNSCRANQLLFSWFCTFVVSQFPLIIILALGCLFQRPLSRELLAYRIFSWGHLDSYFFSSFLLFRALHSFQGISLGQRTGVLLLVVDLIYVMSSF